MPQDIYSVCQCTEQRRRKKQRARDCGGRREDAVCGVLQPDQYEVFSVQGGEILYKKQCVKQASACKFNAAKEAATFEQWIAHGRNPASFSAKGLARLLYERTAVVVPVVVVVGLPEASPANPHPLAVNDNVVEGHVVEEVFGDVPMEFAPAIVSFIEVPRACCSIPSYDKSSSAFMDLAAKFRLQSSDMKAGEAHNPWDILFGMCHNGSALVTGDAMHPITLDTEGVGS